MISLAPSAVRAALLHLTDDVSTPDSLAKLMGCPLHEAEAFEVSVVATGLLVRAPGVYANPRFFLLDAGMAFLGLSSGRGAMDPQAVLNQIKTQPYGGFYAGSRLAVYNACMTLVQLGYAATPDGGGRFELVG